jgi:hypothetical protein
MKDRPQHQINGMTDTERAGLLFYAVSVLDDHWGREGKFAGALPAIVDTWIRSKRNSDEFGGPSPPASRHGALVNNDDFNLPLAIDWR